MSGEDFQPYDWRSMADNPWRLMAEEWMLVTAGDIRAWNTMTASWGGFGHLWNMDVVFAFVRPSRYTHDFMEKSGGFTLSFLESGMRKALEICGSVSGRDRDKAEAADIHALAFCSDTGAPDWVSFAESRIVLACRKVHAQDIDPKGFIDPKIAGNYAEDDWHRLYVGAIEKAWRRGA
jgi:flavin reductase (DIM6/NTAB) family NADH-FMN oxidoreductase RutF